MKPRFSLRVFLLATILLGAFVGIYAVNSTGTLIELTADNFDEIVIASQRPTLVAFSADW